MQRPTAFSFSLFFLAGCATAGQPSREETPAVGVYLRTETPPTCGTVTVAPFKIEVKSSAQDAILARHMRREISRRAAGKGDAVVDATWEQGLLTVRVANRNSPPLLEPVTYNVTGTLVRFADPACRA